MIPFRLGELLDMSLIQTLATSNYQATGLPMSIVDAVDRSFLVRAGWTDLCMNFHRANPDSRLICLESDAAVREHLVEGEAYQYKCKFGLWHIAIPIMVSGHHLATMFMTQFCTEGEVPERSFFSLQAQKFGYDLESYLAALDRLPVFAQEKVNYIIAYDKALVRFISGLAEQALLVRKSHDELEDGIRERTHELAQAKNFLENIFENSVDAVGIVDRQGTLMKWNKAAEELYGYTFKELQGKQTFDLYADLMEMAQMLSQLRRDRYVKNYEINMKKNNGAIFPCSLSIRILEDDHRTIGSVTVARDLTETKAILGNLETANQKLQSLVTEADRRNRQLGLLQEMGDVLQSCRTMSETYDVVCHFGPRFFPGFTGALYLLNDTQNLYEMVANWGQTVDLEFVFDHQECWALRRNRAFLVDDSQAGLNCAHVSSSLPATYLCLPMMAEGKAMGVLHLQKSSLAPEEQLAAIEQYAVTVAEAMALSISNLKLRETLRDQAIRDGLTGLFNRRYLEATLERELSRSQRQGANMGIIMMDLDHFKEYNDTFGHEAGDELLRALGHFLQDHIRKGDIACRYGGEEFLLVMPDAPPEVVLERVETLVAEVRQLHLQNPALRPMTISAGVAFNPQHGFNLRELIRTADAALYRAKAEGRDRVVVAD
jgi:diguanylate cyclase (GGDEF)-like protein/PAS domain S-box-containing protein